MTQITLHRTAGLALALGFASLSPQVQADDNHLKIAAPEDHAPIMVMGDHMHKAGEYMVSLRAMDMSMDGNLNGTDDIADSAILDIANSHGAPAQLRVVPQKMDMKMTMLGAMYAPSDRVTLMLMATHIENTMTLKTYHAMNKTLLGSFKSRSEGAGDTTVGALIRGGATGAGKWHYSFGLSLPTGSIKQTGTVLTPMNMTATGKRLPYPMQLGSGSYDLKPSITYNGDWDRWRVGAQANAVVRLNDTNADYRLGDKAELQGWAMRRFTDWLSASVRFDVSHQGKIDGQDSNITLPVQTTQTNFSGGTFANLSLGVNLIGGSAALADHRLAIEWVSPVYQDVHGVQMERENTLMIGWQKTF